MKKLVLIAVMAAGTLAFQSCSSDDNGGGGSNPADTMVPTRLDYGAEGKEFYVYNDNNYLTKYTDTDGYTYDFTYGGGRLTKVVETYAGSNDRYEYTISYPAADKVKIIEKDVANNTTETVDININSNGNIVSGPGSFYEYYSNGNLTKMNEYGDITEYTYNSNLSMIKNVKTAGWVYTYFDIFPLSQSQNLISSIKDEDNDVTNLTYSDYSVDGNLFPKTINYSSNDEQGKITVTYQE